MASRIHNRLVAAGGTDVGCVRTLNEDNYRIDREIGLLIVADGMGGHDAGEVASAHVIKAIRAGLGGEPATAEEEEITVLTRRMDSQDVEDDPPTQDNPEDPFIDVVRGTVQEANSQVNQLNQDKGFNEGAGMGSTLVGMWLPEMNPPPNEPISGIVFHVGDSRLYLRRGDQFRAVTRDHSMYQQWIDFGGRGKPPAQNIILQAMGPTPYVAPDVTRLPLEAGDTLLLCSDGLSGMIPDDQINAMLADATADNLDALCDKLLEQARENGGKDNITVILGYVL
ncbi:MAG: serine/threonine-protein phosphatase [Magnetococcales bacterium]|nr:serine/threonine-protein phosphatase [Magnetococcales bacterium]